jgi:hypothetical protein
MAWIIATLDIMSSSNARDSTSLVVKKSPLVSHVLPPQKDLVASRDGGALATSNDGGSTGTGTGECLPELPEGGLPVATTGHGNDLQAGYSSLPIENGYSNQVDTIQ